MEDEKFHWFGEWVEYRNEEEKDEAKIYLSLWKKFFTRKIPTLELMDCQFVDRPKYEDLSGCVRTSVKSTLGLKLQMKGDKPDFVLSLDELPFDKII